MTMIIANDHLGHKLYWSIRIYSPKIWLYRRKSFSQVINTGIWFWNFFFKELFFTPDISDSSSILTSMRSTLSFIHNNDHSEWCSIRDRIYHLIKKQSSTLPNDMRNYLVMLILWYDLPDYKEFTYMEASVLESSQCNSDTSAALPMRLNTRERDDFIRMQVAKDKKIPSLTS